MSKISFAKVAGAGSSAPVESAPAADAKATAADAKATVVDPTSPQNLPAVQPPAAPPTRFLGGDEDEDDGDRSDIRLPRLNIVQGMSGAELKNVLRADGSKVVDGDLVLKRSLHIPQPARLVVAGFSRKVYSEKLPKFGEGKIRVFDTLEEVHNAGGTDQWRQSRENKDKEGIPLSRRPWFVPMVTGLLLLQKWEGIRPEDEEHFTAIAEDGTAFAPCVFTVKSTSFGSFYVPLKSENAQGVLSHGYYTRYVKLTTREVKAFEPNVVILEPTSEAVRTLAKSIRA